MDLIKEIILYLGKNDENLTLSEEIFFVNKDPYKNITIRERNKFNYHSKFLLENRFVSGYISKEKSDLVYQPSVRLHYLTLTGNILLYICQSEDIWKEFMQELSI